MAEHNREDLLRYLAGDLTDTERRELESHIKDCGECSGFLSFAGGLKTLLKELPPEELGPDTPCPAADTLVAFAAGQLEEGEAQQVRKHVAFCSDCFQEFALLRQTTESAGIRLTVDSWQRLLEKLKDFVIDLGKTYGPGALVGSIRISAEEPVIARGAGLQPTAAKVLEFSIRENKYSIELAVTEDGSMSCDITGSRTPQKVPLHLSVRSGTGEELISTVSDEFGNSRFVIPRALDDLFVLTLNLEENEQHLLFRVPLTKNKSA